MQLFQDQQRFVISCVITNNIYIIDIDTKEVMLVEDRTGLVLDVLTDTILSLHESPGHGQELRLGTLVETQVTTIMASTEAVTTEEGTTTAGSEYDTTTSKDDNIQVTTQETMLPLIKNNTLPDPCQELIDSLLEEMRKEAAENAAPAKLMEASLADTTTRTSGDLVDESTVDPDVLFDTTPAVNNADNLGAIDETSTAGTLEEMTTIATTDAYTTKPLKGIKMETKTVLSWHPVESAHEHIKVRKINDVKVKTSLTEMHRNGTNPPNLVVFIPGVDGKLMPLKSQYLWLAAGWTVLQVSYPGTPPFFKNQHSILGTKLGLEVDICHQVISDELSEGVYGEVLLLGEGLGGTITSNLAIKYPEEFTHVILINPVLSLPSLIVSRPQYLRRIFTPAGPWFSPVDISSTWSVSPLARVGDMQAAVLIVTTHDTLTSQVNTHHDSNHVQL